MGCDGTQTAMIGGMQRRPTHAVSPPRTRHLCDAESSGGCCGSPTTGIRRWSRRRDHMPQQVRLAGRFDVVVPDPLHSTQNDVGK